LLVCNNSELYVIGGYNKTNNKFSKEVKILNVKENKWSKLKKNMKESRTNLNASACIHRGKLYVFGGEQKGSHYKDYHGIECYDFNTGTWSYFKSLIPILLKKKL